jgi:hypothetical protein
MLLLRRLKKKITNGVYIFLTQKLIDSIESGNTPAKNLIFTGMSMLLRIAGLVVFSFVICYTPAISNNRIFSDNKTISDASKQSDEDRSAVASILSKHSDQADIAVSVFSTAHPCPIRNFSSDYGAIVKAIQSLLLHSFSTYNFYYQHVLLRFQRTDIIFPFHYFW